jgi:hypothetical protein
MVIESKQIVDAFYALYYLVKYTDDYQKISWSNLTFEDISDDEKIICNEINVPIFNIDMEYGFAEAENRAVDIVFLKKEKESLLKILNKYKFHIRIGCVLENKKTGFSLEESIGFTALQAETESVSLKTIIYEGFNDFEMNDIIIIDFIRIYAESLIKKGINLYRDNEIYLDIELFLHNWQDENNWRNSEHWFFRNNQ